MARAAIIVGVGCVLLSVAWFAWSRGESGPTLGQAPAGGASALGAGAAAALPAAGAPTASSERTLAPTLDATSEVPPVPADAKWVDVLVVDKATAKPIADADACWADGTEWAPLAKLPPAERFGLARNRERLAQRFGRHGRSDREGRLRVNLGANGAQLYARAGSRFGEVWLNVEELEPRVRRVLLEDDASLRVRVVDAADRPVADVSLSLENYDPARTRPINLGGELQTDADGLATFEHVQSRRFVQRGEKRGQPVAQWRVWVGIPGIELAPVLVDAQNAPAEPIVIGLPPAGRLRTKVTFDGRPLPGDWRYAFHTGPREDPEAANQSWRKYADDDGWARFPYVPLGKTLFVDGPSTGSPWDLEVVGPVAPEQEVVAVLEIANDMISLVGRLLRADGSPVASRAVEAEYGFSMMTGTGLVETDAQGRFVWVLESSRSSSRAPQLGRLNFVLRELQTSSQHVVVPRRDLASGRNDLGDLRLGVEDLIVGGRLVCESVPLPRAALQVQRVGRGSGAPVRWEGVAGVQIDLHEDGSFEVRGTVAPGRHRLAIVGPDFLPVEPVEFAVGQKDVAIALQRGASLEVPCLLPAGVEPRRLIARLQPAGAAPALANANDRSSFRQDPLRGLGWEPSAGKAAFRWPAVAPGTYTLRIELPGFPEPLLVLPDVALPQPAAGDARLAPLDLREAVALLRLRLVAPSDPGAALIHLFPLPQPADRDWEGMVAHPGQILFVVQKRPLDVLIAAEGVRPVTLHDAVGAMDVRLEAWPTVPLRVLGCEALPAGAQLLAQAREPVGDQTRRQQYRTEHDGGPIDTLLRANLKAELVQDGVATLPIGDGVFELGCCLQLGGRSVELTQFTPRQIVAGAPVTVQLSVDEIRAVVARLQPGADAKK